MASFKKSQHTQEHNFEMACRDGNLPEIKLLLKDGIENFGILCLERAIRYSAVAGQSEVLQLLTEEPYSVDITKLDNESANSSLMAAVAGGYVECVKILTPLGSKSFRTHALVLAMDKEKFDLVEPIFPHIDIDVFFQDLFSDSYFDEKTRLRVLPSWVNYPDSFYQGLDIIGSKCESKYRKIIINKMSQGLPIDFLPKTMSIHEQENLREKLSKSNTKKSKLRL